MGYDPSYHHCSNSKVSFGRSLFYLRWYFSFVIENFRLVTNAFKCFTSSSSWSSCKCDCPRKGLDLSFFFPTGHRATLLPPANNPSFQGLLLGICLCLCNCISPFQGQYFLFAVLIVFTFFSLQIRQAVLLATCLKSALKTFFVDLDFLLHLSFVLYCPPRCT